MTPEFEHLLEIEQWVNDSQPDVIRERLTSATGSEKADLKLSIMTRIANGDPAFEIFFPEFAHANPANYFGNTSAP